MCRPKTDAMITSISNKWLKTKISNVIASMAITQQQLKCVTGL